MSARAIVGNSTSIIGLGTNATIEGFGLQIEHAENIIVPNLCIAPNDSYHRQVQPPPVVRPQRSSPPSPLRIIANPLQEFWSQRDHGVDFYDGLVDVTRGCDYMILSWNYFHSHWKTSLVGGDPT
jgi:pectate lyase